MSRPRSAGDRFAPAEPAEVARRFADAYNAAAMSADPGPALAAVATPTAVVGYLVESQSGVVAPLASWTAVPPGARLELDPDRAMAPFPEVVLVPFSGHGFPREDFIGEAELHFEEGKITRVLFRAP
jgi:hypothetical protein